MLPKVFKAPSAISIFFLKLWHKVSLSLLGPCCRFEPSCSVYAKEAIEEYGFLKGWFLGIKRVLKCQPFFKGGYDPVPECDSKSNSKSEVTSSPKNAA